MKEYISPMINYMDYKILLFNGSVDIDSMSTVTGYDMMSDDEDWGNEIDWDF